MEGAAPKDPNPAQKESSDEPQKLSIFAKLAAVARVSITLIGFVECGANDFSSSIMFRFLAQQHFLRSSSLPGLL